MRGSRDISLVPSLHRASTDALIMFMPEVITVSDIDCSVLFTVQE